MLTVAAVKSGSEFNKRAVITLPRAEREGETYIVSFAGYFAEALLA